jgi:UDP-2,3-diacylglucosamine hydrolase
MSHTFFISDLHLRSTHRQISAKFLDFMQQQAAHAEALYILGDLFEYWAGDDDLDQPFHQKICDAIRALSQNGTAIFIMCGNRDFLMGSDLVKACGATLLNDPTLINLYGQPTLISHGDTLCTDDVAYQNFRKMVRGASWQKQFLAQALATRKQQIESIRAQSDQEKKQKESHIMDVNTEAVCALLREHHYPIIIHGHTHRPAHHLIHLDDVTCHRWVLSDWDDSVRILRASPNGIEFVTL